MILRFPHALSAHLFAHEPLRFAHLREAADAGFAKIELWAMTPHFDASDKARRKALRGWLDDLSLSAPTFHAPFYSDWSAAKQGRWLSLASPDADARADALRRTIRAMRALRPLGARIAILHPGAPSAAGEADAPDALEESVARLLTVAEETDAVLALENIPAALGRAEPLAGFVERVDHPRLKICIDTGHALITEKENAQSAVERLAPLCAATHLHDNDGRSDAHAIAGDGLFDWPSFFATLEARGYRGPLTFELRKKDEPYRKTLEDLARVIPTLCAPNGPHRP